MIVLAMLLPLFPHISRRDCGSWFRPTPKAVIAHGGMFRPVALALATYCCRVIFGCRAAIACPGDANSLDRW